jgi:hypothetical protein
MRLTFISARKSDRLADFISQEEARGVGPSNKNDLDDALSALIKAAQSADQTSRSPLSDGSPGK